MANDRSGTSARPLGETSLAVHFCYHDQARQMSFAGTRVREPETEDGACL